MAGGSKVPLDQRIQDIDRYVRKNETFTIRDLAKVVRVGNRRYSTRELTRAIEIMLRHRMLIKKEETVRLWPMNGRKFTVYTKILDLRDVGGIGGKSPQHPSGSERELRVRRFPDWKSCSQCP